MAFVFDSSFRARLLALPATIQRGGAADAGLGGRLPGGRQEFREHRPYLPGDDLRDLDWNVFLRSDQLAVKTWTRDEAPETLIVVDRSGSLGAEGAGKDRILREVAAALAYVALVAGSPVAFALPGPGGLNFVGRFRSPRKLEALLALVQGLVAPDGPTWLDALRHLPPVPPSGRITWLLSDFLVEPLPVSLLGAMARGAATGWLLQFVSEDERHPDLGDAGTLRDPETGERLSFGAGEDLLSAYAEELAAHEADVAAAARRHGLGHQVVTDAAPFESAVLHCLRFSGGVA